MRIWKTDLKPSDLTDRMAIELKDKPSDLLCYYKFNDGKGEDKAKNEIGSSVAVLKNMEEDMDWVNGKVKTVKKENKIPAGVNTALYFNGEANYLDGAGKIDLTKKSFTIEFWAKRNRKDFTDFIIGQGTNAARKGLYIGYRPNNKFTFGFYSDDLDGPTVTDTKWHHWAVTFDATTKAQIIYQDGKKVAERKTAGLYQGSGDLQICRVTVGNGINYFNGAIDELRIWNTVRTANEIQADKSKLLNGKETGLVRYYPFDEGKGALANDKISKTKLSLKNMDVNTDWVAGVPGVSNNNILKSTKPNFALGFDGTNDKLTGAGNVDLKNKSFSIEFWAKRASTNRNDYIIGQGTGVDNKGLHIGFRRNNQFTFAFHGDDLNSPSYADTDWHHWAVTYDAFSKKQIIYQDGQKVAERNAKNNYQGSGELQIGKNFGNAYFKGQLDEIMFWTKVRTAAEIKSDSKGFSGTDANLVRYYKFDDAKGGAAKDETGKSNAILKNMDTSKVWIKRQ